MQCKSTKSTQTQRIQFTIKTHQQTESIEKQAKETKKQKNNSSKHKNVSINKLIIHAISNQNIFIVPN